MTHRSRRTGGERATDRAVGRFSDGQAGATAVRVGAALVAGVLVLVATVVGGDWRVLSFGVVGLAVLGDDDDPIEGLTARIRAFRDGETVDFDTDRDDDVGELYEAVGALAEEVRECERRDERAEQYRRRLYEITSDPELTDAEKIDRLLNLGSERLGVQCGFLTSIDPDTGRYEVEHVGGEPLAEPGTVLDLSETFCRRTIDSAEILGIYDAVAEGHGDDPAYTESDVACYVGGKVIVGDELHGTVCFFSERPRERPFSHDEKAFVDLMSRWVAHVLERRERTEQLRLVERAMEAAPMSVSIADIRRDDQPIVSVNDAFEELTGYEESEVLGRNCRFLQGEDTDEEAVARLREAIESETSVTVELRNYRKDGTAFWNRVSLAPVENADGEVTHYVGFQEDVTDRRETEQELRRRGSLLDTIFEQAPVNLYVKDEEARHVRTSAPYLLEEYADVDEEETFVGKTDPEVYDPDLAEETYADDMRVIETGEPIEEKLEYAADEEEWVLTSKVPWREDGEIRGLIGVTQYVTEQRERERRINAIVQNTTDPIYIRDPDGVYQFVNRAAADLFGLTPTAMEGRTVDELFDPGTLSDVRAGDQRVLSDGETVTVETETTIDGERRVFLDNKYPYRDDDGEIVGIMGISREITDRKERERQLRETNERLNAVIEASPDAIVAIDRDGVVEVWNPAAERIFGWNAEEVIGEPLPIVPDEHADEFDRFVGRIKDGESIAGAETRRQRKDGALIDVDLSAAPLRDEDGTVVGVMAALEDITERKRQDRELRETKRRLEIALAGTNTALWERDLETNEIEWDETLSELLGLEPDEFDGAWSYDDFRERVHPDDLPTHEETVQRAVERGESFQSEFRIRHGDGSWVWLSTRGHVVEDDRGKRMIGINNDITDRKARERELRETKRRLEIALAGTNTGIWEWDLSSDTVTWNETLEGLVGLDPGEFGGTYAAFRDRVHPADLPEVEADVEEALEGDGLFQSEFRLRHEDGGWVWVGARGHLVREDGERHFIGINNDITDRKTYERELQQTREMLEQSQRLASVGAWEVDVVDGRPVSQTWTDEVYRIYGLPVDADVDVQSAIEFYHPDERETVRHAIERAARDGQPYEFETRLVTAGDTDRWVRTIGEPVLEDGEVVAVRGSIQDVTDRKTYEQEIQRRERELAEYQQFIDDILDAIDDVFYVLGSDGSFERWNESVATVTGYSHEELAGMNSIEMFPDEAQSVIQAGIREVLATGTARVEAPVTTKAGDSIDYEFVASRVENPDGETRLAGIGRDISARKERERKLETRSTAIEAASDGIAILDADEEYVYVNQAHADIYGWEDPEAFVGESWDMCYATEEADRFASTIIPKMRANGEWRGEATGTRKDGSTFPQEISLTALSDGGLVCVVRDISGRKAREAELQRTKDLLQQAGEVAAIGGWEVDLTADPPAITWTDELYRLHDLPPGAEIDIDTAIGFYHPEDRSRIQELFDRAAEMGEDYDMEARIETADGRVRWVRAIGKPVREDGEVVAVRGSIQDITDQKERELALQTLHETTRGLLATGTQQSVAELVVESASAVLETDGVGLYLLDEAANRLEPTAHTARFEELCESVSPVGAGDAESLLWETFVTGTAQTLDTDDVESHAGLFGTECESALLVPVGDHGVFAVTVGGGAIDGRTRQLTETLVATTEAALDRLESEASLRERDDELEDQNRRLKRQIQVTDIIRRIDRSLIRARSRAEIEEAVCAGLADAEDVAFAWIGGVTPAGDRVEPRAWAGTGDEYLDAVSLATDEASPEPAVETATSGEATVVSNVVAGLKREPWRKQALAVDFHSTLAVPLRYEGYVYGVLTVYADEPDSFGDLEREVFAELGTNIANSINAVETRRALHADTLVELRLRMDSADTFLGRIAREADCRVEYEGLATHTDSESRLFFRAVDASADAVDTVLEGLVSVTDFRRISERDESVLYEVAVTGETVPSRLVRHGATPRSMDVGSEETEIVVDIPTSTDVREFVEMLREAFPSVELLARRTVERTTETRQELATSLFADLTDRQLEVLRTAYFAGFFEWPRESTGEDVAEMLGVTQPTVNRHLRLAQGRLLEQLFEDAAPTVVAE